MFTKKKKKKKKLNLLTLQEEEVEVLDDPEYVARINFETFKSIFKRNPEISKSKNGRVDEENFKIERLRESNSSGVVKSVDSIRLKKTPTAIRYMEMANRSFGVKAREQGDHIYFNYDIEKIEQEKARNQK